VTWRAVLRYLRRLRLWCPDCCGLARLSWVVAEDRWRLIVWHDRACPALRSAAVRRAVDRYLLDQVAAAVFVADYEYAGDVASVHRRGPAPIA
jgi:hypothetical protein